MLILEHIILILSSNFRLFCCMSVLSKQISCSLHNLLGQLRMSNNNINKCTEKFKTANLKPLDIKGFGGNIIKEGFCGF